MTYLPYFEPAESVGGRSPTSGMRESEKDVVQLILSEVKRGLSLWRGRKTVLCGVHPVRNVRQSLTLHDGRTQGRQAVGILCNLLGVVSSPVGNGILIRGDLESINHG